MHFGGDYRALVTTAMQSPDKIHQFQKLRRELFVDSLGWNLTVHEAREIDEFDLDDAINCLLYQGESLLGGFRALRCDGPYLAKWVFPQLALQRPYPEDVHRWEISRFGVAPGASCMRNGRLLYSLMFRFGIDRQAHSLVAIADLIHERFLSSLGIATVRYGPPQVIGIDRLGRPLEAVAGEIPLHDQKDPRFHNILELAQSLEVQDETLVLGRIAVPA